MSTEFVHLNVHSAYSLHAGASRLEEIAARAAAQEHEAIALTDTDACYGSIAFQPCCDAAGVRAIVGAEVTQPVTAEAAAGENSDDVLPAERERAVLLAEDAEGWRRLSRIVSARRLHGDFSLERAVARDARGLVVLTPSPRLLRAWADALPKGSLYGEVVAHAPGVQRAAVVAAATRAGAGVAGTHRVFFDRPGRHRLHRVLLAIGHLKLLSDVEPGALGRDGLPLDLSPPAATLLPPRAAGEAFRDVPGAAAATVAIARRCRFRFEKPKRPRLPTLSFPAGETAYGRLVELCWKGLRERYRPLRPDVLARLERELLVIHDLGFADYFLIVEGLAAFARARGIPVVGRGSAASSLVAYALKLTSVDPIRYDLPFERFLSRARTDCPDIDLDLDWRGRDEVIRRAYETYGEDRVAMISTHVTFQARAAVRDVARTLALSPPDVARLVEHLPHRVTSALDPARRPPELATVPLDQEPWRTLLRASAALDGLPRHLSIHTGGIVVGDGPLADSIPLERAAKGLVVTQFEMRGVEATGLVKIDLLGNRGLAVVADVARHARECEGATVDLDAVPEDDAPAAALLEEGRTLGCFQVESPAMRNLVVRMGARTQEDAMIALSLIRPGPASSGMKDAYVRRRRGEEETPKIHPSFDGVTAATHGVMLYQEDALRVASAVGGFDLAKADTLRRAFSKKRAPDDLPRMEEEFRAGAAARGVPADVAATVWGLVRNFSSYSYVKAHAATYARISWQALSLKARYPAEYLAAVLKNGAGFYPARAYVEEARRLSCSIALPCVNRSEVEATGCRGTLRLGLAQVKGLREGTPGAVVRVREAKGAYLSLADLVLRTELERAEVERLVLAGALDGFDAPRPELLWRVSLDFDRLARERGESAPRLFPREAFLRPRGAIPVPPRYPPGRLLDLEMETLGLTATAHPMELVRDGAAEKGAIPTKDLARHVGRRARVAGWVVTDRRVRTAGGKYMKFVMLEDLTGTVETVFFPDAYRRAGAALAGGGPLLVTGVVRNDHGALTFEAHDVEPLAPDEGAF